MQTVFQAMYDHLYSYMIPICLLCVYRIGVCLLELGKIKSLRDKEGKFRSSKSQYTEIYCFGFALIGGILTCLLRELWFVFIPVTVILGVIGGKLGAKKGREIDELWRDVAEEMRKMETPEIENAPQPALEAGDSTAARELLAPQEDIDSPDGSENTVSRENTAPDAEE